MELEREREMARRKANFTPSYVEETSRPTKASENALFCLKHVVGGVEIMADSAWII